MSLVRKRRIKSIKERDHDNVFVLRVVGGVLRPSSTTSPERRETLQGVLPVFLFLRWEGGKEPRQWPTVVRGGGSYLPRQSTSAARRDEGADKDNISLMFAPFMPPFHPPLLHTIYAL
jgi:hypothetical protein